MKNLAFSKNDPPRGRISEHFIINYHLRRDEPDIHCNLSMKPSALDCLMPGFASFPVLSTMHSAIDQKVANARLCRISRLQRPQGRAYDHRLRQQDDRCSAYDRGEKEQRIPTMPDFIEALGLKGC